MKPNIPYIVTKASDDRTFVVGDHISMTSDGLILNRNAGGWLDASDVAKATKGMEVEIDKERFKKRRETLHKNLQDLTDAEGC